ncbi:hypothetical protein QOZ80_5AG0397970 [Eleusine coracana subsp. coracana]|nr:hypothetical protein QOZ80_5AG0397970 [Eleusine coracana subsp. coracana]
MVAAVHPASAPPPAEHQRFSDVETEASSTCARPNSSLSSGSSTTSSSLSRLSFDCSALSSSSSPPPPAPASSSSRPHRSSDPAWAAILAASKTSAPLGPKDFKLIRRIGGGDIGTVYLCRLLAPTNHLFAMKVVDRRLAAAKRKLHRAAAEARVLRRLDHPFLPTLYACFDAGPRFACAVTEFCPGGDLHALRHRVVRPGRRAFTAAAARFYAAEVLLALEYLHMLGIVYRDLKPENVLVRDDGHVMLTDFDLALESTSHPQSLLLGEDDEEDNNSDEPEESSSSCFPSTRRRRKSKSKSKTKAAPRAATPPCFVVEARSRSFVGTHEYVAPEVAAGGTHGAGVDWWALGVFLYELLHGRTPFAGADNEATLRNVVRAPLAFPSSSSSSPLDAAARDLIAALLVKDPEKRLGARRGAAEVKAHPFFEGVNFALMREATPPVVPGTAAKAKVDAARRSLSCKAVTAKVDGVRRSQSCKAAPAATTTAGFDLFF